MTDASAVVWTRATGEPRKLGLLVKAGNTTRFTYDRTAAELPGISVVHDTRQLAGGPTLEFKLTEQNPLPPMFQALVPPRDDANLQRRILLHVLQRETNLSGLSREEVEWLMLLKAGRNGIGHLDIFSSDEEARSWYANPTSPLLIDDVGDRPLWKLVTDATSPTADPITIERAAEALRIHPSPGGVMPKILCRIRDDPESSTP